MLLLKVSQPCILPAFKGLLFSHTESGIMRSVLDVLVGIQMAFSGCVLRPSHLGKGRVAIACGSRMLKDIVVSSFPSDL